MRNQILSERVNLFEPYSYIGMIAKLQGSIDCEAVKGAVMKAYEANESTMSRIELTQSGEAFYERIEYSGCKVTVTDGDPLEIYKENVKKPFCLREGELIRTFLIPEEKGLVMLVLSHHLAGDGLAICELIQQILRALDGETLEFHSIELLTREEMRARGSLYKWMECYVHNKNLRWDKEGFITTWDDYQKIHKTYWANHHAKIEIQHYDEVELNHIKEQCKEWKVTVNSYMTAFLQHAHKGTEIIGMPVSVRGNCKALNNMTTGIRFTHRLGLNENLKRSAQSIAKKVHKSMRFSRILYVALTFVAEMRGSMVDATLMQAHHLYDSKLTRTMAYLIGYQGSRKTQLGVTNLGVVDMKREYRQFSLEKFVFMPPKVTYADRTIGIVTFNNQMYVSTMEEV